MMTWQSVTSAGSSFDIKEIDRYVMITMGDHILNYSIQGFSHVFHPSPA